jgi:PAS domain S-box-containing protein
MPDKIFSGGLMFLEEYLGGIRRGESVLLLSSIPEVWKKWRTLLLQHLSPDSRIVYLTPVYHDATDAVQLKHCKIVSFDGGPKRKVSPASINSFRRKVRTIPSNRILILEDLSLWIKIFGDQDCVLDAFEFVSSLAVKKKWILFCGAVRTSFALTSLGKLKDMASVCFDTFFQQDDVFLFPVSMKGRYKPVQEFAEPISLERMVRESSAVPVSPVADSPGEILSPEGRYGSFFQQVRKPLVLFHLKSEFIEPNQEALALLGIQREEFLRNKGFQFLAPGDRFKLFRAILALRKKNSETVIVSFRRHETTAPLELQLFLLGKGLAAAFIKDATVFLKQKNHLQSLEEEYDRFLQSIPDPYIVLHDRKIIFRNAAFSKLFHYEQDDRILKRTLSEILTPGSRKKIKDIVGAKIGDAAASLDVELLRGDGGTSYCRASLSPVVFRRKNCLQIFLIDLTTANETTYQLRRREEMFGKLAESAPSPIAVIDGLEFSYCNPAFLQYYGFSTVEEVYGKRHTLIEQEPDETWIEGKCSRRNFQKHSTLNHTFNVKKTDGEPGVVQVTIAPLNQTDDRFLFYYTDITKTKRLETETRQLEIEVGLLNEVVSTFHDKDDLQKLLQSSVYKFIEVFHWSCCGIYLQAPGKKEFELKFSRNFPRVLVDKLSRVPSDEGIGGYLAKTQEPHLISIKRYPTYLAHRTLFQSTALETLSITPLISNGDVTGFILLGATETSGTPEYSPHLYSLIGKELGAVIASVSMVRHLEMTVDRYNQLIDEGEEIYYRLTTNGVFEYISDNVESMLGYKPREFERNRSLWMSLIHPDDKRVLLERTTRLEELPETSTIEYRMMPKGRATHLNILDKITIHRGKDGAVDELVGTVRDVTDETMKLRELGLRIGEKDAILSGIGDPIFVCDTRFQITSCNPHLEELLERPVHDILGAPVTSVFQKETGQQILVLLQQTFAHDSSPQEEVRLRRKSGSNDHDFWLRCSPLKNAMGITTGAICLFTDITPQKTRETALRNSEQVLRNVIDTMGDIFMITDLEGTVKQINKSFEQILGYSFTEACACKFPYPWLIDEEMGRYVLWIASLREKKWLHDFDMTWQTKDGQRIPVSLSTTLLRNSLGEPVAMLNIARDITDRVRLMKDIERRNKQIELINRIVSKANETNDFDEIFSSLTQEIKKFVPADFINVGLFTENRKELLVYAVSGIPIKKPGEKIPLEKTVSQYVLPDARPVIIHDLLSDPKYRNLESISKGVRSQLCVPILLKGRVAGTLNIGNSQQNIYTAEHIEVLQPLAQHLGTIIDRVQLFHQVKDDSRYIRSLLDSIDNVVFTVDRECRIREVNHAWHNFMQKTGTLVSGEYAGKNLFDLLSDAALREMFRNVVSQLLNGLIRIFSDEYTFHFPDGNRVFQITINPMSIAGTVTGLVFTYTDITALKRSESRSRRFNEQLLLLTEISVLISTSPSMDEMLEASLPLLRLVTAATSIIVYLIHPGSDDLVAGKQIGFDDSLFQSIVRLKRNNSLTGRVVESREPLYIESRVYDDARIGSHNRDILQNSSLESMAVIPLISKDNVIGALDFFYTSSVQFSAQDRQILTLVGSQLGSAIEAARLYSELRSQIGRLTALYELSQQLTSVLEIDRIIRIVAQNIFRIIHYGRLEITSYDETSPALSVRYEVDCLADGEVNTFHSIPVIDFPENTPEWTVISFRRSIINDDRTILSVPMLSKETITGVITLHGAREQPYMEHQRYLLENVANLAAIALDKGKLYEETIRISEEIQRRNKELDDFTYVVSHDLKEPLISIEGFSRILHDDYREMIQDEGKEYLTAIVGATTRMKGLIDDLLMLSRVSRPSEVYRSVSLNSIIEEIATDMKFSIKQRGVRLVIPEKLPDIWGNETQLKVVFRNLIGNAIKFNDKVDPVVEVGFRNAENNYYLFWVKDNGIGIEKEFYEKIFVIFQRLHRREEYEGSGAGLAIVKKIVEMHKGIIWVESEIAHGSTFFLTLPMTQLA